MSDSAPVLQKLPYLHRRAIVPALPDLGEDTSVPTDALEQFEQNVRALTAALEQFDQDVSLFTPTPREFVQNVSALTTSLQQFGQRVSVLACTPEQLGRDAALRITALERVGQDISTLAAAGQADPQHVAAAEKSGEAARHLIALVVALIQQILSAQGVPQVPALPDLDNVQGDVCFLFPKRWERFLFFRIADVAQFRKGLGEYAPRITSARQTYDHVHHIHHRGGKHRDIVSTGIAFARAGLHRLGIDEKLGDPDFDKGSQYDEREALGDRAAYHAPFDAAANTDGIILVTARERDTCEKQTDEIKGIFDGSIDVVQVYEGRVRQNGAEHFGYKDGISQPALAGISKPKPGQRLVRPGVIILGYPGDPLHDAQSPRPSFTRDGSFMAFRKLEQNPLFFKHYVNQHWDTIPAAPDPEQKLNLDELERKDLFSARLFGRFKSGVPLALRPYRDDPSFDPGLLNDFDYTERKPEYGCPLAAHIHKTAPRNLRPFASKALLDAAVMVRAAIPYGDDPTPEERTRFDALDPDDKERYENERGLFFVSYQSSIVNGFLRQTGWACNDWFPPASFVPNKIGQDPIIGSAQPVQTSTGVSDVSKEGAITLSVVNSANVRYEISGVANRVDTSASAFKQQFFVRPRGGEWYFVPGIRTVQAWAAEPGA